MTTCLPARAARMRGSRPVVSSRLLLPVAPQGAGVGLEVGHGDAGAGERLLGAPGVEDGGEAGVGEHLGRDADAADRLVEHRLHRAELDQAAGDRRGTQPAGHEGERARAGRVAVERDREPGRPGGGAERVEHVDRGLRLGVDEVEGLAVAVGQVREVVHRLGDVVDRDDVGVAEVDPDQRQPGRQGVAQQLHHREEVVGAVDLVHRAGLGVTDDDRRPVDPPRHRRLGRARSSPTRTSCGGTARAGAGPRRTSSRRRCRRTHRRRRPRRPGGSTRRAGRRPARSRAGCRRRSSSRWWRRRRSCRRSRRGGRSGRSTRRAPRPRPRRRRARAATRSPTTVCTRAEPQRRSRVSMRASEPSRTRTKMSPSRWSTSSWTR